MKFLAYLASICHNPDRVFPIADDVESEVIWFSFNWKFSDVGRTVFVGSNIPTRMTGIGRVVSSSGGGINGFIFIQVGGRRGRSNRIRYRSLVFRSSPWSCNFLETIFIVGSPRFWKWWVYKLVHGFFACRGITGWFESWQWLEFWSLGFCFGEILINSDNSSRIAFPLLS